MTQPAPTPDDAAEAIAAARDRFDFALRELHLLMSLAELRGVPAEVVTAAARMTPEAAAAILKRHGCGYGDAATDRQGNLPPAGIVRM